MTLISEAELSEIKIGERFRKNVGDIKDLEESIRKIGLLQPIGLDKDNNLCFGERRLKAWKTVYPDKPIPFVLVTGDLYEKKLSELHENKKRKDLDWHDEVLAEDEIKQVFTRLYGWEMHGGDRKSTEYRKAKRKSSLLDKLDSQKKLAKELGTSEGRLSNDLQLAEEVKKNPKGKIATKKKKTQALSALKDKKKREKRNEVLSEASSKIPDDITLYLGDFRDRSKEIPSSSIQLILTDPPYAEKYLSLWDDLAEVSERLLITGGFLVAYCPHFHLPLILDKLQSKLEYFWVIALKQKENTLVKSRNAYCVWKPIIVFYKPPLNLPRYFSDFIEGTGKEKENHEWQQAENEIYQIIENFCPESGTVLDPMAGSGTTLIVAKKLGRKSIGIEIEATTFAKLQRRIVEETK